MEAIYRSITLEEVFFIFKEEHRLCSPFDIEADPTVELSMDSTIEEWRYSMDLLSWRELSNYLNKEFEIKISETDWRSTLKPAKKKTMRDVCELISLHAKIEVTKPIKILGKECLSAAIFKFIKRNFFKRGIDTTDLKPSSSIIPYLNKDFGVFIEQINKNHTGVIPEIKITKHQPKEQKSYVWIFFWFTFIIGFFWHPIWILSVFLFVVGLNSLYRETKKDNLYIPGIETYRDLVEKIIEKEYA